ncbi:MAG TPA: hypothetical protein VK031_03535 [Tissierellaceae bacterium]|nr:hypothetical protein [Tissierellaceae bacterium]
MKDKRAYVELQRYKKATEFLINREAELVTREEFEKRFSDQYSKSFESLIDLLQVVKDKTDTESGNFWFTNLVEIKGIFPLIDNLISDNTRLKGSFQNLYKLYREQIDLNIELQSKIDRIVTEELK